MFKTRKLYPCMALIAVTICLILLSNCGGGGNSTIVPSSGITPTENAVGYTNPTPTPVLTNVSVTGYIYANNITTEEGETVPRINVLDVPACQADSSGNEPFISQVESTLKTDYPEEWAKTEVQELYAQLNKTLSESKPLSEINGQVYSVYADSQSATPIPVSSDGYFDNTVLTGVADSNVKLEVALGEDNYTDVETLPSSDNINSSDATTTELKSCPEKIFAFPGEIVIFKIQAEPGINLKSAGLRFTLNNSSIGCITQPVYLCIFGAHKYQVAYGCLYIKNGLNTPVDTIITAKTNNGLTLNIFTEVIKKTASISGTVYTGGMPLVKGFVHSLGPKACCKLDPNGGYTLPKVFRGHERSVIATWWTMGDNGKKIKHREEKVIDFFSSDVSGFNFGVPPTPTPTLTPSATPTMRPPMDPFYTQIITKVTKQYGQWEKELGTEQAIQKTVDWLNNIDPNALPKPEFIDKALMDNNNKFMFWIVFSDGWTVFINTEPINTKPVSNVNMISQKSSSIHTEENNKKARCFNSLPLHTSVVEAPKTSDILILCPPLYEFAYTRQVDYEGDYLFSVYGGLAKDLQNNGYNVTKIVCEYPDAHHPKTCGNAEAEENQVIYDEIYNPDNSVSPEDFPRNMSKCGVNFIFAHGESGGWLDCGAIFLEDRKKRTWMDLFPDGKVVINEKSPLPPIREGDIWAAGYCKEERPNSDPDAMFENYFTYVPHLYLTYHFFERLDFNNSIVYLKSCYSFETDNEGKEKMKDAFRKTCNTFVGHDLKSNPQWGDMVSYFFFRYMMYGFDSQPVLLENPRIETSDPVPYKPVFKLDEFPYPKLSPPMSVQQAYDKLKELGLTKDTSVYYDRDGNVKEPWQVLIDNKNPDMYFPIPVKVYIDKN
ncbi:MAG: hypothetical protein ABRQ39_19940 [Candidatus Eremiobacterota bacterium]